MSVTSQTRYIPFVSKSTEDLLMWRDAKKSAILFVGFNLVYFFIGFSKTPFVTMILYGVGISVGLLTAWARFGSSVGRPMPQLPAYLREGVTETDYNAQMARLKPYLDSFLEQIGYIVSCRDMTFNVKMVVACLVVGKLLSFLNPLTLGYICFLVAFIAPKVYEQNKEVIDDYIAKGRDQTNKYIAVGREHLDKGVSSAKQRLHDYSQKVPALKPWSDKLMSAKKTA